jgi:hypothetical protein
LVFCFWAGLAHAGHDPTCSACTFTYGGGYTFIWLKSGTGTLVNPSDGPTTAQVYIIGGAGAASGAGGGGVGGINEMDIGWGYNTPSFTSGNPNNVSWLISITFMGNVAYQWLPIQNTPEWLCLLNKFTQRIEDYFQLGK